MTLRGMIRISALGAGLIVAIALASAVAHGQGRQPQVSIEPRRDTIVTIKPLDPKAILFGFDTVVVDRTRIPATAPRRAYCVRAEHRVVQGLEIVELTAVVSEAEPELTACQPEDVPLVIRPTCELSFGEHVLWRVQKIRPVILFCGQPDPNVFLFGR